MLIQQEEKNMGNSNKNGITFLCKCGGRIANSPTLGLYNPNLNIHKMGVNPPLKYTVGGKESGKCYEKW